LPILFLAPEPRIEQILMIVAKAVRLKHVLAALILGSFLLHSSCDELEPLPPSVVQCSELLLQSDVEAILAHAVEQAQRLNQSIHVAVTDREGNILGVFAMTGSTGSVPVSFTRARTAAYLSSNQNAFTTLTASFITRPHFPPGVLNTAAGPLFGVGFSSLPGGDVMPNGSALNDRPGGIPIYKNGCLAGGIGVSGAATLFDSSLCTGQSLDEVIALGAVLDFPVPVENRGDNIFIDGIRFLYANASAPAGNYSLTFAGLGALGSVVPGFSPRTSPAQRFPFSGEVNLDPAHDFSIRAGSMLTASDVRRIIDQAAAQAARTRAAIRRPPGVAAQVFIAVVDTNGAVLGIWRTPDATLFSFDVAAQKGRTALAFSNPNVAAFGGRIRTLLGIPAAQPLAITTRAIGFLAQDYFPPGIDRSTLGNPVEPGPLFEGTDFAYQRRLLSLPGLPPYGNGITLFPGGIPLYRNGQLVGAIGVSGDGVDQDDLIAFAGSQGFEPPPEIRSDRFFYHDVRLPYIKVPRRPEL
jgi:uncharacterized protein GlcG (DUF336 family)